MEQIRCRWAVEHPELMDYHDLEWGSPQHEDKAIFGSYAQCVLHAGLLWTALLKKRDIFKLAFSGWDFDKIARYDESDIDRLMNTDGMIRNLVKINCVIGNAKRFREVREEFGSFNKYVWGFVGREPIVCDHISNPATKVARELAADLKRRGFKFAGEATAIGLMQDIGMINDHDKECFRHGA